MRLPMTPGGAQKVARAVRVEHDTDGFDGSARVDCVAAPGRDPAVELVRDITRFHRRAVDLPPSTDTPDLSVCREPLAACRLLRRKVA